MTILEELGSPLGTNDVAKILGIDQRTVRKYAKDLGGVVLPNGRLRFFDNRIRSYIDASTMQTKGNIALEGNSEKEREGSQDQVVRTRQSGRAGIQKGPALGGGDEETTGRGRKTGSVASDPHGIFDDS